jgi:hypothetical protein
MVIIGADIVNSGGDKCRAASRKHGQGCRNPQSGIG